jgi:hypothetical protein
MTPGPYKRIEGALNLDERRSAQSGSPDPPERGSISSL